MNISCSDIALEFPNGAIVGQYYDFFDNDVYVLLHSIIYPSGNVVDLVQKNILVWSPLLSIQRIRGAIDDGPSTN